VEPSPCFVLVNAQEGVCPSLNQLGPGSLCAYSNGVDGQCDAMGKCEKCSDITGCLAYGDECKCLQCSDEYTLTDGTCKKCGGIGELIELNEVSFCSIDFIDHIHGEQICKQIGMSLPSVRDICPNWNGKEGKTCSDSLIKEWSDINVWTSTSAGTEEDEIDGTVNKYYQVSDEYVNSNREDGMAEVICM